MMKSLLALLPRVLRGVGDSSEAKEQAVFAAWEAAVGAPVRRVTSPVKLERKTLIVAVLDSTWRSQLRRLSGQALFKLNSLLGAPTVTAIDFVVNRRIVLRNQPPAQEITFTAPEEQSAPLRAKADAIPNPDVRDIFLRAAGKCLERRAK
jgi:Dna[CI] antecedent DciA-like protein